MIRVLLVDDQPLVLAGLGRIIEHAEGLEVVGECADGDEVAAAVTRLRPDIVLMDVRMKRVDGAEATRRLSQTSGPPPVLVLTTFDDEDTVAAALGSGAAGFILKDAPGEHLIAAVRRVAAGGAWLDPAVTGPVIEAYRGVAPTHDGPRVEELTEREVEVLRLVGRGATNTEIDESLFITEGTVKSHITHIFTKLGLRDRAAAIVYAFDQGLVRPGQHPGPTVV